MSSPPCKTEKERLEEGQERTQTEGRNKVTLPPLASFEGQCQLADAEGGISSHLVPPIHRVSQAGTVPKIERPRGLRIFSI